MRSIPLIVIFSIISFIIFSQQVVEGSKDLIIAKGKMPNMVKDKENNIHVVYGTGDSIMYVLSKDGKTFTSPTLIAVLPNLFASAMRGPQIAVSTNGVVITACTNKGNIYSYKKEGAGKWTKATKVNAANETAKEALMALSADGNLAYAVWLGVKKPRGQEVYGALSNDGGKTWQKNVLVYSSPDSTVCECCKPSVVVKEKTVHVMFRNWLKGSRDLYVTKSTDGGNTFAQAVKLGEGTWKLNGCPMDGGGLVINKKNTVETVWRREGKIYTSAPGMMEKEIGEGKGCTIETVNNKKVFAWTEKGEVVFINSAGKKKIVGKGSQPVLKALNDKEVLCVWENDRQIHSSLLEL